MKRKTEDSKEQKLSDLRATLAEDEAYRVSLADGTFQARQVDAKIATWKRMIANLSSDSQGGSGG